MDTTIEFIPKIVELAGPRNTTAKGVATIKNVGPNDFTCRGVSTSCGCTLPHGIWTGTEIKAGDELEISFEAQLKTPGTKYIYVSGNSNTISLALNFNITE
jgi:hypothetical protein